MDLTNSLYTYVYRDLLAKETSHFIEPTNRQIASHEAISLYASDILQTCMCLCPFLQKSPILYGSFCNKNLTFCKREMLSTLLRGLIWLFCGYTWLFCKHNFSLLRIYMAHSETYCPFAAHVIQTSHRKHPIGFFYRYIWPFSGYTWLFCGYIWLFSRHIFIFCRNL